MIRFRGSVRAVGSPASGSPARGRSGLRGGFGALLAACAVILAGCSSGIVGVAAPDPEAVPPAGKPLGYVPSDFEIQFADADGVDQVARDALEDIIAVYSGWYPEVFGTEFEPLKGGYFSIEPGEGTQSGCMDGPDDEVIQNNAFYCSFTDEIAYWRPLMDRFASEYSDMQVGLVLAHELGHAIQAREGVFDVRSIVAETQADCFAGTWARAVADGKTPHFQWNPVHMDETLLAWALELPSAVGSDPDREGQHGSAFDRVTAMQEGYERGPEACRDNFNDQRLFTSAEFDERTLSDDGQGNASYAATLEIGSRVYSDFYTAQVPELGGDWATPRLLFGGSDSAQCTIEKTVSYCPATNAVIVANEASLQDLHGKFGDFAMVTALGIAYSEAAVVSLGFSNEDPNLFSATSCLAGALSGDLIDPRNPYDVLLSPGDFDEATVMLLTADAGNPIVDLGDISAFDRMDAFRTGVHGGVQSCGLSNSE